MIILFDIIKLTITRTITLLHEQVTLYLMMDPGISGPE